MIFFRQKSFDKFTFALQLKTVPILDRDRQLEEPRLFLPSVMMYVNVWILVGCTLHCERGFEGEAGVYLLVALKPFSCKPTISALALSLSAYLNVRLGIEHLNLIKK